MKRSATEGPAAGARGGARMRLYCCRREGVPMHRGEPVMRSFVLTGLLALVGLCAIPASAQPVTKETVPGITNLARLETTIACAGAITADSVPEIKKMGFVSIVNLPLPPEAGGRGGEGERG